jgi:hypothetical protein
MDIVREPRLGCTRSWVTARDRRGGWERSRVVTREPRLGLERSRVTARGPLVRELPLLARGRLRDEDDRLLACGRLRDEDDELRARAFEPLEEDLDLEAEAFEPLPRSVLGESPLASSAGSTSKAPSTAADHQPARRPGDLRIIVAKFHMMSTPSLAPGLASPGEGLECSGNVEYSPIGEAF